MLRDLEGTIHDPVEDLDAWIEAQANQHAAGTARLDSPAREAAIASL